MTERKPAGMPFETWVERQIREAQDRGEFDNLCGAGKPLADLTGEYDEMWWVNQLMRREKLSALPPMLALRKEAEELLEGLADMPSEVAVRDWVQDYNARVVEAIRRPQERPFTLIPRRLDVDETVAEWARRRAARTPPTPKATSPPAAAEPQRNRGTRFGWRRVASWIRHPR